MRALWRGLMDSWPGQLCLALFTSMASIRYSFSCSLTRSSRQALQAGQNRPGMAANLGTTVSLLWGCLSKDYDAGKPEDDDLWLSNEVLLGHCVSTVVNSGQGQLERGSN
eukprot:scaffold153441_cov18-Tisochrysis_lutea.AAC.1